jgi:hypothetical protein
VTNSSPFERQQGKRQARHQQQVVEMRCEAHWELVLLLQQVKKMMVIRGFVQVMQLVPEGGQNHHS